MKNVLSLFRYLPALAGLITGVEEAFGPKNGANKKKAVVEAFTVILSTAAPFVETANPAYAAIVDEAVDFMVSQLNKWANLSGTPAQVPDEPQVHAADPYSVDYFSVEAARSEGKPGDHIYSKPDGSFRLVYGGAGGVLPSNWTLVSTIGG